MVREGDIAMNINEIRNIIQKQARTRGYRLEERKSVSTDSWYFKIYHGEDSLLFRVANHKTTSSVITLRTDHKISREAVERFARNRCDELGYRHLKSVLGV